METKKREPVHQMLLDLHKSVGLLSALQDKAESQKEVLKLTKEILNHCIILCSNWHREHHTKYFMKLKK